MTQRFKQKDRKKTCKVGQGLKKTNIVIKCVILADEDDNFKFKTNAFSRPSMRLQLSRFRA